MNSSQNQLSQRSEQKSRALAIGLLLVAIASIQVGASVAKSLFPKVGAEGATFFRVWLAAFLLLSVWRPWRKKIPRSAWRAIAWYGGSLGLMNLIFYFSIARIPLGLAVALEFVGPLAVALFGSRRGLDAVWAVLAAVGIGLVLPIGGWGGVDPLGAFFALLAGVFWGLYIVLGKRAGAQVPSGIASSLGMAAAGLVILPAVAPAVRADWFSAEVIPTALGVALLSSAIPYSLEMFALRRLPSHTFGILMSLEPAVAALAGLAFLGETLTFQQTVAIGLIIAASVGSTASAQAELPPVPEPLN